MKKSVLICLVIFLIFQSKTIAQRETDIEGGKDYSLISRFKGSVIEFYDHKSFDEYTFLLGFNEGNEHHKTLDIEGEVTRIQYSLTGDHSVFEVFRNYENALKESNFSIVFTWSDKEEYPPSDFWPVIYYGQMNKLRSDRINPMPRPEYRYLVSDGKYQDNNIYVVLFICSIDDWILTTMDVIEEKPMETGLVTAAAIEKGLNISGHTVLEGIFFDTGEATIKTESGNALKNIAGYLKSNPDKKFFIVGHTDNTGDFTGNMTLSEGRAKAVMNELIAKYEVVADQLEAHGVSSLSPVASNSSDEGKAKNRRVEIVEQ
jgi:OOP family OmpA-OmpF porin